MKSLKVMLFVLVFCGIAQIVFSQEYRPSAPKIYGCEMKEYDQTSGWICTKCIDGYFLPADRKTCDICSSNCMTCKITATNCISCKSRYYRNFAVGESGECLHCPNGCSRCTSSTHCTSCSIGNFMEKNAFGQFCKECDSSCYSCNNSTSCIRCAAGYAWQHQINTANLKDTTLKISNQNNLTALSRFLQHVEPPANKTSANLCVLFPSFSNTINKNGDKSYTMTSGQMVFFCIFILAILVSYIVYDKLKDRRRNNDTLSKSESEYEKETTINIEEVSIYEYQPKQPEKVESTKQEKPEPIQLDQEENSFALESKLDLSNLQISSIAKKESSSIFGVVKGGGNIIVSFDAPVPVIKEEVSILEQSVVEEKAVEAKNHLRNGTLYVRNMKMTNVPANARSSEAKLTIAVKGKSYKTSSVHAGSSVCVFYNTFTMDVTSGDFIDVSADGRNWSQYWGTSTSRFKVEDFPNGIKCTKSCVLIRDNRACTPIYTTMEFEFVEN